MANTTSKPPEFHEERSVDPVAAATGPVSKTRSQGSSQTHVEEKRKAGFYLSIHILNRFNRKFYELKLNGIGIENKSALLERALSFALDDMDRGDDSQLLQQLSP